MFIIGQANEKEIAEIEKCGFDVENVDVDHFNKALSPNASNNPDSYLDKDADKLIAIYLDYDIAQECRDINLKEMQLNGLKKVLETSRNEKIEDIWLHYNFEFDNFEYIDSNDWEHDGVNKYTRTIYIRNLSSTVSISCSFVIEFQPNSIDIENIALYNNENKKIK